MPSLLAISIDNTESSQQQQLEQQQQKDSGRSEPLLFQLRQKTKNHVIRLPILFKKNRRCRRRRRRKKLLHPTQSTYHPLFC